MEEETLDKCLFCYKLVVFTDSNFCSEECRDEYSYYDDEPDVDELQENQDFAHDDDYGLDSE